MKTAMALMLLLSASFVEESVNTTPRFSDFRGLYNVSPQSHGVEPGSPEASDFLCLKEGLDLPSYQEVNNVAEWFVSLDQRLQRAKAMTKGTSPGNAALRFNVEFNDRTAEMTLCDPNLLSLRLLEHIRSFLQAKAPLWRVVVRGIDDQTTIVVYPTAVVLPATTDRDTQLSTIREKMLHHRDRTVGVFNRQLEYAKQVLASWAPVSKPPYMPRVVCAFDSDKGDTQCLSIWILEDGYGHEKRSWIPDDETTDGFQGIAGMTGLDVTEDGHVAAYMTAGDKFVGVLTGLIYSKRAFRGSIELREPSTGKRQKFEIAEETILSDEEVQRRLGFKSR